MFVNGNPNQYLTWQVNVIEISCLELCNMVQVGLLYKETTNLGTAVPFLLTIVVLPIITVLKPIDWIK
jgi:hypothetical protein